MSNKIWENLELKTALMLLIIIVLVSVSLYYVFYNQYYGLIISKLQDDARVVHRYTESVIDEASFYALNTRDDEESELYKETFEQLNNIRRVANLLYLYTAKTDENGQYIYVVDGLHVDDIRDDGYFCHIGDLIEPDIIPFLERCLNNEIVFGDKILDTDWGAVYVAYFPFHDSDGNIIGAIGMEFDCDNLYESTNRVQIVSIIVAFSLTTFFVVFSYIIVNRFVKNAQKAFVIVEKEKAQAESANNAKSTFLANMSHEIRTPMNAILGAAEIILEDDELPSEHQKGLLTIYNSGSLLLGIINDILDLSKIEAGKLDIVPAQYSVARLINDSVQLNALRIDNRVIDFILKINDNIPAKLIGDELRIKQILNNLLSNAFKYTDSGSVTLKVDFTPINDSDKIQLILCVSDTGHGMTPEQINGLFVEYARYNQQSRRTIEGTGLGLSITKRIIDLMGGTIDVTSSLGFGSEFLVKLPQDIVDDDILGRDVTDGLVNFKLSFISNKKRAHLTRTAMPYGKVLIVDDVDANLYVAEGMLKLYKMQIDIASSGQEAIDKIRAGEVYDVIFMDHMMPVMDGIEATKIIRETGYTAPIVALTANVVFGQEKIFLENGFNGFIPKPIDSQHLDAVVNRYVRDSQIDDIIESARWLTTVETDNTIDEKNLQISSFLSEKVDGLDIASGLEKLGNDEESYRKTLNAFASGIGSMLQTISQDRYDNIEPYRIAVHGIKGACFDIFANDVGNMAKRLEMAAKIKDINYISENNALFLEKANKLIDDISRLLTVTQPKRSKPIKDSPSPDVLKKLLVACEAFDMYNAEAVMEEIERYEYNFDDGLAVWLRENIDLAKFKDIVEKLKGVL